MFYWHLLKCATLALIIHCSGGCTAVESLQGSETRDNTDTNSSSFEMRGARAAAVYSLKGLQHLQENRDDLIALYVYPRKVDLLEQSKLLRGFNSLRELVIEIPPWFISRLHSIDDIRMLVEEFIKKDVSRLDSLQYLALEHHAPAGSRRIVFDSICLKSLSKISKLNSLKIDSYMLDEQLHALSALAIESSLEHLDIEQACTDQWSVGTLPSALKGLRLAGEGFGDGALRGFCKLHKLKYLTIEGTGITSQGFAAVENLKLLQKFSAVNTEIGPTALASLSTLPRLRRLEFTDCTILGQQYQLNNFKSIKIVHFMNADINDAGVAAIVEACPQVEAVVISSSTVTGSFVLEVGTIPEHLSYLFVSGPKVRCDILDSFAEQNSTINVECDRAPLEIDEF